MKPYLILLFSFFVFTLTSSRVALAKDYEVPVLIIGGGASGVSAGIQTTRLGVKALIIEETDWLGGMLTSAGVSAIDGNHQLPSGLWGEFRAKLYNYYGGPEKVETGWVSNTLFEPAVGNQIWKQMAKNDLLQIWYKTTFTKITKLQDDWMVQVNKDGMTVQIKAHLLIDCTELGDAMAAFGAHYFVGMDSKARTHEAFAPDEANSIVQDLTYVAILKDYGKGTDHTIPRPKDYDPEEFKHSCDVADPLAEKEYQDIDCQKMLDYGKLPNGEYMINWPKNGNDIYLNIIEDSPAQRQVALQKAKQRTLRFVYYIQTALGYRNLGLTQEFGTKDQLPKIPYYRESRRLDGLVQLTLPYVADPYQQAMPLYRTGVIVGDYSIDHHHLQNPDAPKIDFVKIKVPSYNVPLGALIPKNVDNFIVAEKSISVSNIVAGATRLQPVVIETGQAAGVLAAVAIRQHQSPSSVDIRTVQQMLLDAKAYLMPYIDVKPSDSSFQAIQRIGATGILKGIGNPYKWANQTWFYPQHFISGYELVQGLKTYYPVMATYPGSGEDLTIQEFSKMIHTIQPEISEATVQHAYGQVASDPVMRREQVAVLIDQFLHPFHRAVNWYGALQ